MTNEIAEPMNLRNGSLMHGDRLSAKICQDAISEIKRLKAELAQVEKDKIAEQITVEKLKLFILEMMDLLGGDTACMGSLTAKNIEAEARIQIPSLVHRDIASAITKNAEIEQLNEDKKLLDWLEQSRLEVYYTLGKYQVASKSSDLSSEKTLREAIDKAREGSE